ncbi:MAG TPA: hypothetical protein VLC12_03840, partial [Terriglobales bacterium]|nr:hypothetical protein [Terriglobales bacterium]
MPSEPNTFYFGGADGGIWKTVDAGLTWKPEFQHGDSLSIGALAVAPSNPNVIYIGTGQPEQSRYDTVDGAGVFRSNDGGKTWRLLGLSGTRHIGRIWVDPRNPDVVVVAALGHIFGPNDERGVFRSEDGGKHWQKVLFVDANTGAIDLAADPAQPDVMFAATWQGREWPWFAYYIPQQGPGSGIWKSTDGGKTWTRLSGGGLPGGALGRIGLAVAPGTNDQRVYALIESSDEKQTALYRSDDGGSNWKSMGHDGLVSGYFDRMAVDPKDPDTLYVMNRSVAKSTDGGKTFSWFKGAPGGDDYHFMWINPDDDTHMVVASDQGTSVSVDGGRSWSSWYNQPTGQFYHVSTDNVFPYRVYGAQQDSGTASVLSRSDYGEILQQDWHSVGGFEYAYITPDPAHPDLVYSGGWYGSVVRFDQNTGQIATVFEDGQRYRSAQMPPLVFSPQDPSVLYLGTQFVLKTADGGAGWHEISPDLTGYVEPAEKEGKAEPGRPKPPAITALAPSTLDPKLMWAGTSNRRVYLTRTGGASWENVSPPELAEPMQVLYVEASHHDPATAYLTVGATRESTPPLVLRTHDFGKTWQKVVTGLPGNEMCRIVREDPKRKGLLFAGTDTGVFVSWDDGDHWQSLSLNLPPTPVTDIQVHGDGVAISTFGRGLWIMDDITPLREINSGVAAGDAFLFAPAKGMRVRWDNYQDTPYPRETPAGENPPDGAIIDYFLKTPPSGEINLKIYDEKGTEIARFSSQNKSTEYLPPNVPGYWFAPDPALTKASGLNRFVWDLRYPAPAALPYSYYGELLQYSEYTL